MAAISAWRCSRPVNNDGVLLSVVAVAAAVSLLDCALFSVALSAAAAGFSVVVAVPETEAFLFVVLDAVAVADDTSFRTTKARSRAWPK